jgi:hypothetical protein
MPATQCKCRWRLLVCSPAPLPRDVPNFISTGLSRTPPQRLCCRCSTCSRSATAPRSFPWQSSRGGWCVLQLRSLLVARCFLAPQPSSFAVVAEQCARLPAGGAAPDAAAAGGLGPAHEVEGGAAHLPGAGCFCCCTAASNSRFVGRSQSTTGAAGTASRRPHNLRRYPLTVAQAATEAQLSAVLHVLHQVMAAAADCQSTRVDL